MVLPDDVTVDENETIIVKVPRYMSDMDDLLLSQKYENRYMFNNVRPFTTSWTVFIVGSAESNLPE